MIRSTSFSTAARMAVILTGALLACGGEGPNEPPLTGRTAGPYALRDISDGMAYEGDWPRRLNDQGDVLMYSRRFVGGATVPPPAACKSTQAINNRGHVLCSLGSPDPQHLSPQVSWFAIWDGQTLTPVASVDSFPAAAFQAWALNDLDQVVGTISSIGFTNPECPGSCGVIWQNGQPTFLPVSALHTTLMNDKRDLLVQDVELYTSAVRLYESASGQGRRIGDSITEAGDLNDQGWVVGTLQGDRWQPRSVAFLDRPTGMTLLGTGEANGINDDGDVVGVLDGVAVMWKSGAATALTFAANDTSWTVTRATDINNRGQIAAVADDSAHAKFNRAVILTPIAP